MRQMLVVSLQLLLRHLHRRIVKTSIEIRRGIAFPGRNSYRVVKKQYIRNTLYAGVVNRSHTRRLNKGFKLLETCH